MCTSPLTIKNPKFFRGAATVNDQAVLVVPCGKCAECTLRKRNEWLFRIQSEVFHSSLPSYFLTLTYSDEDLPVDGVSISDLQKFFKRLRHVYPDFKYYAVAEYGGKFQRPHYHVILIGYPYEALLKLDVKWNKGFVYVGSVEPASIKYVAAHHSIPLDELTPKGYNRAFRIVSKGLGLSYLTPSIKQYFEDVKLPVATIEGGVKVPLPRYIKNKLGNVQWLSSEQDLREDFDVFSKGKNLPLQLIIQDYNSVLDVTNKRCRERLISAKKHLLI